MPPNPARPRRRARRPLIHRLWSAAEKQVAEIEARLSSLSGDPALLERDAKILAVIARTLRDLVALEAETRPQNAAPEREDHAGNAFRSLEAFRAELAQRLDALRRERPGPDPAGGAGP
ncbi:MAG: hypothetical protein O9322_03910 [Beijerinckiaceae bacterium]|nr:hypothetical protein [Beijerinckiaceae bacterium]MCZ8298663.1 hypothetical protein [Beijerinckiaceae bacterium]